MQHTLYSETDASSLSDATVSQCALSTSPSSPPSLLSPFLSEDWTAFCSQGPETQAVSAGNIFHSLGPTEALAATRYGSFQSLVLLGKYGSLWTGPLCRLGGEWEKTGAGDEDNWMTRYECACQTAIATRQFDGGFPLVRTLKGVIYVCLFLHQKRSAWIVVILIWNQQQHKCQIWAFFPLKRIIEN